jgi:spore maturation protein CgeB
VERIDHLPPAEHGGFYAASRFTLNVTRADMIAAGWSPSVRLFEAAACGTPVISDRWPGIEELFTPEREIILADDSDRVVDCLAQTGDPRAIGQAARARVLDAHTAADRAAELEQHIEEAAGATKSCPEAEKAMREDEKVVLAVGGAGFVGSDLCERL